MALLSLLFKQRVRIGAGASAEFLPYGAIELDASIEETHVAENEVTQFPVESGVDITDHVRRQPYRVNIRGIVTDHPLIAQLVGTAAAPVPSRSADAYGKALLMAAEAQLVTVVTTLNTYDDMVIESLEVPRDSTKGHAVEMVLSLREVMTAQVATTAGTSDLGTKPTTVVN